MAQFSRRSRYRRWGIRRYNIYAQDESSLEATPTRRDRVVPRRYTTWKPADDSFEYVTKPGDTLAGLAQRFYRDAKLWWVISDHNPAIGYAFDLEPNTVLTVPSITRVGLVPSVM